jgi:hypothetical protein
MRSMLRQSVVVAAVALVATAGALGAQAPAARDVAGTYTAQVNSPQGPIKVVIVLKKEAAAYTGTLSAEGFPTLPISSATPTADGVKVMADSPDGGVTVTMKSAGGDKMTGTLTYQGMEMPIEGTYAGAAAGAAISPVGEYAVKTTEPLMGEANLDVVCTISKGADGKLGGSCVAPAGAAPVTQVTVAGNVVTMAGESPAGPYTVVATVVGTAVTGSVTLGGEVAKFTGKFTAK